MLLAVTLLAGPVFSVCANAQTFFYTEVAKDGRLYVFAVASRHDAFVQSGGVETGPVITRPGYGTNGETVVFDSADAVNLYNFKHGLPSESFPAPEESPRSEFPAGKISGLMFGDYYWYFRWHQDQTNGTNPTSVEGQHGLWFRRIYFTYDLAFNERLGTRFRLEMNSNGDFEDSDLVPYVKDASLQWKYVRDHYVTLGIQPSLTFGWLDEFWGLRHIEKTPAALYRLDSSRDFGVAVGGPVTAGVTYAVQLGNESGTGSEAREGKILRLEGRYERPRVALEGFYSFATRPDGEDRHTAQTIGGVRGQAGRAGGQYLWQARGSGGNDAPDQTIGIWSGFAVWDVLPKKADLFFRIDGVAGHRGGVETGLPGADEIDYLLLSPQSKFTMWIFGGEVYLNPAVRFSPNLELVNYAHDPDPVNFPGRDRDSIARLTFFWTF